MHRTFSIHSPGSCIIRCENCLAYYTRRRGFAITKGVGAKRSFIRATSLLSHRANIYEAYSIYSLKQLRNSSRLYTFTEGCIRRCYICVAAAHHCCMMLAPLTFGKGADPQFRAARKARSSPFPASKVSTLHSPRFQCIYRESKMLSCLYASSVSPSRRITVFLYRYAILKCPFSLSNSSHPSALHFPLRRLPSQESNRLF